MVTLASFIHRKKAKPRFYIALCLLQELLNEACSKYRYVHFVHKRVLEYGDGWKPDGLAKGGRKRCSAQSGDDVRVLETIQNKTEDLVERENLEERVNRTERLRIGGGSQLELLYPTYSEDMHLLGIAFRQRSGAKAESVD